MFSKKKKKKKKNLSLFHLISPFHPLHSPSYSFNHSHSTSFLSIHPSITFHSTNKVIVRFIFTQLKLFCAVRRVFLQFLQLRSNSAANIPIPQPIHFLHLHKKKNTVCLKKESAVQRSSAKIERSCSSNKQ
jgi:hypothetical protein